MKILKMIVSISILVMTTVSCSVWDNAKESDILSNMDKYEDKNQIIKGSIVGIEDGLSEDRTLVTIELVERIFAREEGINVNAYPENDITVDGRVYSYIEVVFGDEPAVSLFVDVDNELLFNGFGEIDRNSPLNLDSK